MRGVRLGKILGFEISIDWSWVVVFFLVVFAFANSPLRNQVSPTTNWLIAVAATVLLFASVVAHELSHSLMARRYGIEVKGITLFIFGGVSQTADEPKSAAAEFWMAIVGPLTSFLIGGIFLALSVSAATFGWPAAASFLVLSLARINIILGVFNLLPGFPLDGGRVLRSVIWGATGDLEKSTRYASYSGQFFGYLLIGFGALQMLDSVLGGVWLIFIGWFLAGAARSSYQQLVVREALSGVPVDKVMTTDVPCIDYNTSIRSFVDDQLLKHDYACYPVMRGDEVIGVVGTEEVRKVPSRMWDLTPVGEVAHRVDSAYKIQAGEDMWEAMTKLASEDVCRLLVMEDDRLKGTVGREAIYRLVRTKLSGAG